MQKKEQNSFSGFFEQEKMFARHLQSALMNPLVPSNSSMPSNLQFSHTIFKGEFGSVDVYIDNVSEKVHAIKKLMYPENLNYEERETCQKLNQNLLKKERKVLIETGNQHFFVECHLFENIDVHTFFIQMPLYEITIDKLVNKLNDNQWPKPLAYWFISVLMQEVFEAVEIVHEKRLVPRDLKPANIFVSFCGSKNCIKIGDFGMVKLAENSYNSCFDKYFVSNKNQIGLTKFYRPLSSTTDSCCRSNDVYSLGVIYTEVLIRFAKPKSPVKHLEKVLLESKENIKFPNLIASKEPQKHFEVLIKIIEQMLNEDARKWPSLIEIKNVNYNFSLKYKSEFCEEESCSANVLENLLDHLFDSKNLGLIEHYKKLFFNNTKSINQVEVPEEKEESRNNLKKTENKNVFNKSTSNEEVDYNPKPQLPETSSNDKNNRSLDNIKLDLPIKTLTKDDKLAECLLYALETTSNIYPKTVDSLVHLLVADADALQNQTTGKIILSLILGNAEGIWTFLTEADKNKTEKLMSLLSNTNIKSMLPEKAISWLMDRQEGAQNRNICLHFIYSFLLRYKSVFVSQLLNCDIKTDGLQDNLESSFYKRNKPFESIKAKNNEEIIENSIEMDIEVKGSKEEFKEEFNLAVNALTDRKSLRRSLLWAFETISKVFPQHTRLLLGFLVRNKEVLPCKQFGNAFLEEIMKDAKFCKMFLAIRDVNESKDNIVLLVSRFSNDFSGICKLIIVCLTESVMANVNRMFCQKLIYSVLFSYKPKILLNNMKNSDEMFNLLGLKNLVDNMEEVSDSLTYDKDMAKALYLAFKTVSFEFYQLSQQLFHFLIDADNAIENIEIGKTLLTAVLDERKNEYILEKHLKSNSKNDVAYSLVSFLTSIFTKFPDVTKILVTLITFDKNAKLYQNFGKTLILTFLNNYWPIKPNTLNPKVFKNRLLNQSESEASDNEEMNEIFQPDESAKQVNKIVDNFDISPNDSKHSLNYCSREKEDFEGGNEDFEPSQEIWLAVNALIDDIDLSANIAYKVSPLQSAYHNQTKMLLGFLNQNENRDHYLSFGKNVLAIFANCKSDFSAQPLNQNDFALQIISMVLSMLCEEFLEICQSISSWLNEDEDMQENRVFCEELISCILSSYGSEERNSEGLSAKNEGDSFKPNSKLNFVLNFLGAENKNSESKIYNLENHVLERSDDKEPAQDICQPYSSLSNKNQISPKTEDRPEESLPKRERSQKSDSSNNRVSKKAKQTHFFNKHNLSGSNENSGKTLKNFKNEEMFDKEKTSCEILPSRQITAIIQAIADHTQSEALSQELLAVSIHAPDIADLFMALLDDDSEEAMTNKKKCRDLLFNELENTASSSNCGTTAKRAKTPSRFVTDEYAIKEKLQLLKMSEEDDEEGANTSKVVPTKPVANVINKLMFTHSIGSGAFGDVDAYVDTKSGKKYAIKKMKCPAFLTNKSREEFENYVKKNQNLYQREASVLTQLNSQNLFSECINVFINSEINSPPYFCIQMPLYEMTIATLVKKLRQNHWPTELGNWFISVLMQEVFEAVEIIHVQSLTHRDLKPDNILISFNGSQSIIKVADFGLARPVQEEVQGNDFFPNTKNLPKYVISNSNKVGGTSLYRPENVEYYQYFTPPDDIYCVGVTYMELLMRFAKPNLSRKERFETIEKFKQEEKFPIDVILGQDCNPRKDCFYLLVLFIEKMVNPEIKKRPGICEIKKLNFLFSFFYFNFYGIICTLENPRICIELFEELFNNKVLVEHYYKVS